MLTIRQEVQAFLRVTELLLSPAMLGKPLNEGEWDTVAVCAQNLMERYPSGKGAAEDSLRAENEALLRRSRELTIETLAVIERSRVDIENLHLAVEKMRRRMNNGPRKVGKAAAGGLETSG
jgi:hypothetical protein